MRLFFGFAVQDLGLGSLGIVGFYGFTVQDLDCRCIEFKNQDLGLGSIRV